MPLQPPHGGGLPTQPYRHKPSRDGNALFAKLPPEIRCEIWRLLLVRPRGPVIPVHIPRDTKTEAFVSMEMSRNRTLVLDAVMRTCRLFYQDQEEYMVFYKFNVFQFPRTRDCLAYVAAITPSRCTAIRNITITLDPIPYNHSGVKNVTPGDRLRCIAILCPNLRVLRHEKFFYRTETLTDWAVMLSEILEPVVATLPLLKEVYIRGGNGGYTQMECHMTLQSVEFAFKTSTVSDPYNWATKRTKFSERGEKALTTVWELLSKRRPAYRPPLYFLVKDIVTTTPILTHGHSRGFVPWGRSTGQGGTVGVPQNAGLFSTAAVPGFIFNGLGTVKDIRFPRTQSSPDVLIGTIWYPWDAIFQSNRMSETCSKYYMRDVSYRFQKKYVSWVYFSGASKGRRHGDRSPQSKLINCIWRLNWQDRAAKLDILKDLYLHRENRRRRRG